MDNVADCPYPIQFPFEAAADPPSEADRVWWAEQRRDDRDEADFMAWLDRWHDLPWDYYPGPGLWSLDVPCLPELPASG